jgi:hypothetical protein
MYVNSAYVVAIAVAILLKRAIKKTSKPKITTFIEQRYHRIVYAISQPCKYNDRFTTKMKTSKPK